MNHRFLGAVMSLVFLAFAVAMIAAGFSREHPTWWGSAISLAVLGGVLPMILAVSSRIMPVFLRRDWVSPTLVMTMVGLAAASGWVVFLGRMADISLLVTLGNAASLASGLLLIYNIGQVFKKQSVVRPAPPLPFPEQAQADRIATNFTRLCSVWLLVGTGVGLIVSIYTPDRGRWELVWAHSMLVGFALSMASGVTYHVLPRWTTGRWKSLRGLRIHWYLTIVMLPIMVLGLAIDSQLLIHMAGPFQAAAIALWIGNCLPFIRKLPRFTAIGVGAAFTALGFGIALGMSFAVTPAQGAFLRPVHAELNLFGWAGLLISGVAYYLVPRFAGAPLRWSRVAIAQLALTAISLAASVALLWLRIEGHDTGAAIQIAHIGCAVGFGMLGVVVAGTFWSRQPQHVGAINLMPRSRARAR